MQDDFAFLELKIHETGLRTENNINFLSGLVGIRRNMQGIKENHAVALITAVASFFLPFSTVAAILGMQGNFAPDADRFWVFSAVAVPLTILIIGLVAANDSIRRIIPNTNTTSGRSLINQSAFSSQSLGLEGGPNVRTHDEYLSHRVMFGSQPR